MKIIYGLNAFRDSLTIDIYDTVLEDMLADSYDFTILGRKSIKEMEQTMSPLLAKHLIQKVTIHSTDVLDGGRLDIIVRMSDKLVSQCNELVYKGNTLYDHVYDWLEGLDGEALSGISTFNSVDEILQLIM